MSSARQHIGMEAWFRPVSPRPLAGLRVVLALLLLVHLVWLSGDILALHGSRGIIPWELTDLLRDPWIPGLPTLARALSPLGISERTAIIVLLAGYAGGLLALAQGFRTRLAALLSWGLHLSLVTSGFASFYGVDQLANTFLFYLVLFPSGRAWTVEHRPRRSGREESIPSGCLRVMQIHLCVIYLAAGLDKARGRQWWNGEAIWQAVSQPAFRTFDLGWLAQYPWIPTLAGWATLAVEIGYAFLIWPRRTRTAWALATIALHLGVALFMGLVFFSSVMIALTACLFLIPEVPETQRVRPRRAVLVALIPAMVLLPIRLEASSVPGLGDELAPLVRRVMARDRIPGVAMGLVARGRLVVARGFGYRDVEHHLPVTPDTLFALGSCTKAFTATAIALLADDGRIDIDAPVRAYLPDFALADPVASASLTTRDLLTHRSGLPRHDFVWYGAQLSRDELYRRLAFLAPSGPARTRWGYNSLMYVVAGRIVERVSGQSWESFVQSRLLSPLNMRRTRLSADAMAADPDHASPYALREGRTRAIPMLTRLGAVAPAGAAQSSVRDLARWLTFHTMRSPELLGDDRWRELHRPQAAMPAADPAEVQQPYYALGWVHERYRGHPLVVHNGAIEGFTVHLGFLPETGQGLIILMNRDMAAEALMTLAYSAYDRLLGLAPLDWERRLEERPTPLLRVRRTAIDFPIEQAVGDYEHPAYGAITVRARGDTLVMRFRALRRTLVYQGDRRFLSQEPLVEGSPQISVRFSRPRIGEPPALFVRLNFDAGDPVEEFRRAPRPSP